jgi:hypothetical protein
VTIEGTNRDEGGITVNKTLRAGMCAAILLTLPVAACSNASPPTRPAVVSTRTPTPAPVAGPTPVVTGVITATCFAGIYDKTQNEFSAVGGLAAGSDIAPGDVVAEAFQLSLTDTSRSAPAKVAGFEVAFYADGRRLGSATTNLQRASDIAAGRSMSWTEYPWATSIEGHGPSIGPFAKGGAGEEADGGVNPLATCRLVRLAP